MKLILNREDVERILLTAGAGMTLDCRFNKVAFDATYNDLHTVTLSWEAPEPDEEPNHVL